MIGCRVVDEAIAVVLVGHGIAGVLESYSDAKDVLGFEEERTHSSPGDGSCFASLAHTVDALYGVAGVRGRGRSEPCFQIVDNFVDCFCLEANGARWHSHSVEYCGHQIHYYPVVAGRGIIFEAG